MKITALIAAVALAASPGAALAQTHQHGGAAPAQPPAASAPPRVGSPTMGHMTQNMPEQCRAAMQNMPQGCMGMMQQMMGGMMQGGMSHGAQPGQQGQQAQQGAAPSSPAVAAFQAANARMHQAMDIRYSGNADIDFVRGMIPHHQGAIDMARVLMEHGRDEQTRRWAQEIIREQEREIREMQDWLRRNGG